MTKGKPGPATQKHLFAVSGNRCAFRGCRRTLVDETIRKVTAKICHIKGNRPGSKRYDPSQTEEERQGFDNLIVMCPDHHEVIDGDDVVFTVEALQTLKKEHEAKCRDQSPPSAKAEELFLTNVSFEATDGSVILSANQTGGQIAHTINNNYGTAPEPHSPFRTELIERHLADTRDNDFAMTRYHKTMGIPHGDKIQMPRTSAIMFAHSPRPWMNRKDEPAFRKWAKCNTLRYEPCTSGMFIPGPEPEWIGSALVWNDGGMHPTVPDGVRYTRYIAYEPSGWIEYGLHPSDYTESIAGIYYVQLIANVVGFLRFVRQICERHTIDPTTLSLGFGLRGIKKVDLTCIAKQGMRGYPSITPPDTDAMLFLRPSQEGPWGPDEVAYQFASDVLELWEVIRPSWLAAVPEFQDGVYKGEFFREMFNHW